MEHREIGFLGNGNCLKNGDTKCNDVYSAVPSGRKGVERWGEVTLLQTSPFQTEHVGGHLGQRGVQLDGF